MNYYVYTADDGTQFSIRATDRVAALMSMTHATLLPRFENTTRKARLSEAILGTELLVTDPSNGWTLPLGSLQVFDGDIYYVTALLPEHGKVEAP